MAEFNSAPPWVNPYDPRIKELQAQLAALDNAPPPGPMYNPQEQERRQQQLQHLRLAGQVGMLSGDTAVTGVAKPMLSQALEASKPKFSDHGMFDQITGEFKYFPGYRETLMRNRLAKTLDTTVAQGAKAEENWQRDRARAMEQENLRRVVAGLKGPTNQGSLSYMGAHPETGLPILLDNKFGPVMQGPDGQFVPFQGAIAPKPTDITSGQRDALAKADTAIQGLDATVQGVTALLERDPTAGRYSTGSHMGVFADMNPLTQKIAQKTRPKEVQDLISMTAYIADGIRKELFGATLTALEKASAIRWMPTDYDSVEDLQTKAANLKTLLERDRQNRLLREQRPGLPPPAGGVNAATQGAAPAPAAGGVIEYDKTGKRIR